MLFFEKESLTFTRRWSFWSLRKFFFGIGNKFVPVSKSWTLLKSKIVRVDPFKWTLLILMGFYRSLLVAHMGGTCRFSPSCSEYAVEAIHRFSPFKAIGLIVRRLLRCRPFGAYGFDPVPNHCESSTMVKVSEVVI